MAFPSLSAVLLCWQGGPLSLQTVAYIKQLTLRSLQIILKHNGPDFEKGSNHGPSTVHTEAE